RPFAADHEAGRAPDRPERPHRRVHPAGRHRLGPVEQGLRGRCIHRIWADDPASFRSGNRHGHPCTPLFQRRRTGWPAGRVSSVDRPELAIAVDRTPAEAVVSLAGEIDMLTAPRLAATVNEILVEPPARVVLDMANVTCGDSQGMGTLVVLSRTATTARSVLVLANVADFLLRVLDITGLRSALMVTSTAPWPAAAQLIRRSPALGQRSVAGTT